MERSAIKGKMKINPLVTVFMLFWAGLAAASAAMAQDAGQGNNSPSVFIEACKADIAGLCKDVQPGGGRVLQCLQQNSSSLSAGCQAKMPSSGLSAMPASGQSKAVSVASQDAGRGAVNSLMFIEACREDIAGLCKDVQSGGGRILQCLQQHSGSLSAGCQAKIPSSESSAMPASSQSKPVSGPTQDGGQGNTSQSVFLEACRGDIAGLCKDVQPGGGRVLQCLQQNSSSLSAGCQAKMPSSGLSAMPAK